MSHSSISSSKLAVADEVPSSWRRIRRDVLILVGVLLALEIILRVGPVHAWLAQHLDPYENLLWYSPTTPAYQQQLLAQPEYDVWLLGSSYMMTALDPQQMQSTLPDGVTAQNYGFSSMRNLDAMSKMVEWLLTLDQPRYVVLGVNYRNFTPTAAESARAEDSPYENVFIYTDSVDEVIAGFLFNNSFLYRYGILARNATFIPFEKTILPDIPSGGFTALDNTVEDCVTDYGVRDAVFDMAPGLARMDALINTVRSHDIPIAVLNMAMPVCALSGFENFDDYSHQYLDTVAAHLASQNVPFHALDPQFYAEIPPEEQWRYFSDQSHANITGAALFSTWAGDFIAEWLHTQEN